MRGQGIKVSRLRYQKSPTILRGQHPPTAGPHVRNETMSSSTILPSQTAAVPPLPSCTTAVPDNNGYVPPDACNANYGFYPSWEWNLVFAVVFGLTSLVHTAQAVVFRKVRSQGSWSSARRTRLTDSQLFCGVVVMGSLWECACFALRTLGALDQQNKSYVIISTLLFLLAPLC